MSAVDLIPTTTTPKEHDMHSDHGGYDAALCGWDHCVCQPCPDCPQSEEDYWR